MLLSLGKKKIRVTDELGDIEVFYEFSEQSHYYSFLSYCCSLSNLCPVFCDPMDCSMPGFFALHQLPEFAQTHVHWVDDAIQPSSVVPFSSWPQSFPASGSFPMSQLFTSDAKILSFSFSINPFNEHSGLRLTGLISLLPKGLSRFFSSTTV